ncbi:Ser-Thr-rich glycosyl-phosphatidyl-inositol-anchored membrane family-domain-containing protein [Ustulina deusta]|nr:Ser-Thr-rich glycosyl-phosphatidyl-inositol-anchored membrane family-domain-containing protein [Ustulina deusta]
MRSSTIFASALAFAASALAQTPGYAVVSAPREAEVVPAGKTYTIQWSAGEFTGPATISLMGGKDPSTLVVLDPIGSVAVEDESFAWKVDCSLGEDKTYGIKITDTASEGATFQYSFPFEIKGPSCDSTTSASSSASVSTSVSASASVSTSSSGYPISSITASTTSASAYPTTVANSTTPATKSSSTTVKTSSSTSVKSYTEASSTASTWTTFTTPVVTVTKTPTATGSASVTPATSTTASSPVPTAGAARVGAGLALGLMAAVLAL